MFKTSSGYYGLFFVVLLTGQLARQPMIGSSALEFSITTAISLGIGFLLILPFCLIAHKKLVGIQVFLTSIVLMLTLVTTVIDIFKLYNITSHDRISFLSICIILFAIALYSGLLNSSAIKTAGLFISFLLITVLAAIALFNIPQMNLVNINIDINTANIFSAIDILSVAPLVPAFAIVNQNELKIHRVLILMLAVLAVVSFFSLLAEMVLGSNLSFFNLPINALAIVGELSIFRRFDILLGIIFFITGCIKISVISNSMAYILNQRRFYILMGITFVASIALNLINSSLLPIVAAILSAIVSIIILIPIKKAARIAVFLLLIMLTGCGGVELQERTAVTMTYVDKTNDIYDVSLLVCTEYEETGPSVSLISASGESFSSALYNVAKEVNGELYMGQSELVLLGKGFMDGDISALLEQIYETRMSEGNAFIYLTEYTSDDLKEHEGKLLGATDSILRQSESNRLPAMQMYKLPVSEDGLINGIIPVVDTFEYKGAVAKKGVLYSNDTFITTIDREQLEMVNAINGSRDRIAVEYDYNGLKKVSEVSEFSAKIYYSNNVINVEIECIADEKIVGDELLAIKESLSKRIIDSIKISTTNNVDIFSIEKKHNIELSKIKIIEVAVRFVV